MNEKYLAGLLDADGYISIYPRMGQTPLLEVGLSQKADYIHVISSAKEEFGGCLRTRRVKGGKYLYSEWSARGAAARKCLERLKKYMVLKRHHAERMLEYADSLSTLHTDTEVLAVRLKVKEIRAFGADRIPNYPSRKWLAGYFDGDGSFVCKVCKKTGYAYPSAAILAAKNYTAGVVLLQQAFGGRICAVGENALWQLQLRNPGTAEKFLGYFAQHLQIKQAAAYFIRACAEHNFRDGIMVQRAIAALNTQQHRLSDPASTAADFVKKVRFDIPKRRQGRPPGVVEAQPRKKRQSNP